MSSSSLTSILLDTNLTPQKIQRSSRYIINGSVPLESVTAWRRCLSTCSDDQLLPLLYVANETLQTIARKKLRTKEFLEAFASVLNSSIKEICSRIVASRSLKNDLIEKVRRTIKIWGDRQVYSQRFVGEVLAVCEPFRKGGVNRRSSNKSSLSSSNGDDDDDDDDDALVPVAAVVNENENENDSVTSAIFGDPSQKLLNVDVDMNISRSKKKGKKRPSSNDEEDDDDVFGSIDDDILSPNKGSSSFGQSIGGTKSYKTLSNCLSQLSSLKSTSGASNFKKSFFETSGIGDMVGEELNKTHESLVQAELLLMDERAKMYEVANRKIAIECELAEYISWLEKDICEETRKIQTCSSLEKELKALETIHSKVAESREKRRKEMLELREKEELEKKRLLEKEEELERRRKLERQIKEAEKPGMVYNQSTGEYENIHDRTDDSWR